MRALGLGWLHKRDGAQGFLGHFALTVSNDGSRRPLELAGLSTIVRTGEPLGRKTTTRARNRRRQTAKESLRWTQLALQVHEKLPGAIHVMDRVGDSFEIYEPLENAGSRFIIRWRIAQNRVAVDDGVSCQVKELMPTRQFGCAEPCRSLDAPMVVVLLPRRRSIHLARNARPSWRFAAVA